MTTAQQAAAELLLRQQASVRLLAFINFLVPEYVNSNFADDVCLALERFYEDVKSERRPILILSAPPQHGKSTIASRYLIAWLFGQDPTLRIGGLSYGHRLAGMVNRALQSIMLAPEYGLLFPNSTLNKDRVVTKENVARRNNDMFEIIGANGRIKGSYLSQGVGGPLTGMPLDIGVIDDPIKNQSEALSEVVKERLWGWYTTVFMTRLSRNSGQIIMATRWAEDDLSGRILANAKPGDNITHLNFPAINESGQALIPELHPIEKLTKIREAQGAYFWSAMYQGNPVAVAGNLFKQEWLRTYNSIPQLKYRAIFADTAQKTGTANDYTVFQCWGMGENGSIYLLDQVRGKFEAPELLRAAKAFWCKHQAVIGQGSLRQFYIEDKVSGTGLIQQLARENVPVKGLQRNTDKVTRAHDAAPHVEAGKVYLPDGAPFLIDLITEIMSFPTGTHDDQVDPFIDAVTTMLYWCYDPFSDEMLE